MTICLTHSSLGNRTILERPLTAIFCSARCPGRLASRAYDLAQRFRAEGHALIGGFQTPVEQEVLKVMLNSTTPLCLVVARGLPQRIPAVLRRPLDEGRLLLLSPFAPATRRASRETARRRNDCVAGLATRLVVVYAAPGSRTEALCLATFRTGRPCFTLEDPGTANLRDAGVPVLLAAPASPRPA
ncbi:MAG: DNA-processing protein DprA [Lentisphaerae bacterium]|nr:DNA-processing protein DprA [Lentisphaerota bacterium]